MTMKQQRYYKTMHRTSVGGTTRNWVLSCGRHFSPEIVMPQLEGKDATVQRHSLPIDDAHKPQLQRNRLSETDMSAFRKVTTVETETKRTEEELVRQIDGENITDSYRRKGKQIIRESFRFIDTEQSQPSPIPQKPVPKPRKSQQQTSVKTQTPKTSRTNLVVQPRPVSMPEIRWPEMLYNHRSATNPTSSAPWTYRQSSNRSIDSFPKRSLSESEGAGAMRRRTSKLLEHTNASGEVDAVYERRIKKRSSSYRGAVASDNHAVPLNVTALGGVAGGVRTSSNSSVQMCQICSQIGKAIGQNNKRLCRMCCGYGSDDRSARSPVVISYLLNEPRRLPYENAILQHYASLPSNHGSASKATTENLFCCSLVDQKQTAAFDNRSSGKYSTRTTQPIAGSLRPVAVPLGQLKDTSNDEQQAAISLEEQRRREQSIRRQAMIVVGCFTAVIVLLLFGMALIIVLN